MHFKITIGVIIAIALIFYWWNKDHPQAAAPKPVAAVQLEAPHYAHISFNAA